MDINEELEKVNVDIDFQDRCDILYKLICDDLYVPMKARELAILLNIPKGDRDNLHKVLDTLVKRGLIVCTPNGKYIKADKADASSKDSTGLGVHSDNTIVGTFTPSTRGFGFVRIDDTSEDIFVSKKNSNYAFSMDKVEVKILPSSHGTNREGEIVSILKHEVDTVVGTYDKSGNFGFVIPDNKSINCDIFIPQGKDMRAVDGAKVVAFITTYPKRGKKAEGVITEIIGHKNDPGVDILSLIKSYNVPIEFPEKVINQCSRVAKPVTDADMLGREDFRGVTMVTIDGADAKDLDDAVSLTYNGKDYELGVYIADVANYVQENSAIDREAYKRGTSVYLIDRVIPMLPHSLSNGICSLNEGEDRLAMCCIMKIDGSGNIYDHRICEGVVNINHRMTYSDVSAILDGDKDLYDKYEDVAEMFMHMYTLSNILRNKRRARGGIDFDISETKFELDDNGNIVDVKPYIRDKASMIIEDFMLAANETVAEDFFWKESPFLYRTHGIPEEEKIKSLRAFVGKFGYVLKGDIKSPHPKEFQKLLSKVQGKEEELLIRRLTLRTMQQAKYTVDNTGHFGLAAKYYCHFTSPIRRYPDLCIHRIIKDHLRGRFDERRYEHYISNLPMIAQNVCKTERRAEDLERDVDKLKMVQYMKGFLGEEFEGIVSSVTRFGLFVELSNGIDGLVHISSIKGDYYNYDEANYELVGERTNKRYSIGMSVKVVLVQADEDARTIDFELVM